MTLSLETLLNSFFLILKHACGRKPFTAQPGQNSFSCLVLKPRETVCSTTINSNKSLQTVENVSFLTHILVLSYILLFSLSPWEYCVSINILPPWTKCYQNTQKTFFIMIEHIISTDNATKQKTLYMRNSDYHFKLLMNQILHLQRTSVK